jgi:hypothetical protein
MLKPFRSAVVLAAVPLLSVALAAPSNARSHWVYKSSDTSASADWVEWGELPNVVGNAHVGFLEVSGTGSNVELWGKVIDYQCDEGEYPGGGGGHDAFEEEPGEEECDFTGIREISGGTVTFSVDRKLTGARLTGTLVVANHGAPGQATPPVDMTWTGQGGLWSTTYIDQYTEGGTKYYSKYESTGRDALVSGHIGIMDFTDDADDESFASIQRTKTFERGSTR